MISARRPLRGLSALLLLLSPGVGGQALALLHPCPAAVAAQAAVAAGHDMAAMSHHGAHAPAEAPLGAPSEGHQHEGACDCLGSCHTPALVQAPQGMVFSVPAEAVPAVRAGWPAIESRAPSRPADRLPPPTAPPIA